MILSTKCLDFRLEKAQVNKSTNNPVLIKNIRVTF